MKKFLVPALILIFCGGITVSVFPLSKFSGRIVKFSHKVHVVGQGIECEACHVYVKKQTFAGIPDIGICLGCHESKITDSPEEEKIRQASSRHEDLEWERVFKLPSHVYFSHRRHVGIANIDCVKCHGEVWKMTEPLTSPLKTLVMEDCIECHKERNVVWDCVDCHR
ncbi:MAG: cytochrome c3 family protein [Candidatus Schekmanbacteria bacterium]|nr:cytochrome c3 family protein [Candidatus Schekmanbacteria bacterium]